MPTRILWMMIGGRGWERRDRRGEGKERGGEDRTEGERRGKKGLGIR